MDKLRQIFIPALKLSIEVGMNNGYYEPIYYQQMMYRLLEALVDADINWLDRPEVLKNVSATGKKSQIFVYKSNDAPQPIPGNEKALVASRLNCILCLPTSPTHFEVSANHYLGLKVSRHTIASFKSRVSHFILPFDINLYCDKDKLVDFDLTLLESNYYKLHFIPAVVTALQVGSSWTSMPAFLPQPHLIGFILEQMDFTVDSNIKLNDISEDVLLGLTVLKERYQFPISEYALEVLKDFDDRLVDKKDVCIKINGDPIIISKTQNLS